MCCSCDSELVNKSHNYCVSATIFYYFPTHPLVLTLSISFQYIRQQLGEVLGSLSTFGLAKEIICSQRATLRREERVKPPLLSSSMSTLPYGDLLGVRYRLSKRVKEGEGTQGGYNKTSHAKEHFVYCRSCDVALELAEMTLLFNIGGRSEG